MGAREPELILREVWFNVEDRGAVVRELVTRAGWDFVPLHRGCRPAHTEQVGGIFN